MKKVSLTIDGKQIFADEGTTILVAARKNGIQIPTLCYHPGLAPLGHCRICVVEVEGLAKPVTACDNPVNEGMVVSTDTPLLQDMRREIITLALADHPYQDCLTCEKAGDCELQEKSFCHKVDLPEQLPKKLAGSVEDDNQYIVRDEEKCILCGRCLQVCRFVAGRSVFNLAGAGVDTRVLPVSDGCEVSLEQAGCVFCGQCVDICPVGALVEKGRVGKGREWALQNAPGLCLECSLGCALERRLNGDSLVKVTISREEEKTAWLCRKGKFGHTLSAQTPITSPLIRVGDGFREVSYTVALQKTAASFQALQEKHGSEAIAVLGTGRSSNEESYLLQKLAREVMGTGNLDLGVEATWARAVTAVADVAGTGVYGPETADFQKAGAILILGTGLMESHPVADMVVRSAACFGKAAVVRVGPVEDDGSVWESIRLQPQPDSEVALLQGITAALKGQDVDAWAEQAGVAAAELKCAARLLSTASGNSYTVVTPTFFRTADYGAVDILMEMAKAAGQLEHGRADLLLLSDAPNARGIAAVGGTSGQDNSWSADSLGVGKVKGAFVAGVYPGLELSGLDFVAVLCQDLSEVPAGAQVIFPMLAAQNKRGTFTTASGMVRNNETVVILEGIKADWELICDLAEAMGTKWGYSTLEEVQSAMNKTKGLPSCQ